MTETIDWRDLFCRYVHVVLDNEGVSFLNDLDATRAEIDAIEALPLEHTRPIFR